MCISLVFVLYVASPKQGKRIQKGIMTILITKAKIFFDFTEEIFVILFQLVQWSADIDALPHRYHLSGSMGSDFSPMLTSGKVIAFSIQLDMASSLLHLLIGIFDMGVIFHVAEMRPQGVTAQRHEEIEQVWHSNHLPCDPWREIQDIDDHQCYDTKDDEYKIQDQHADVVLSWLFDEWFDVVAGLLIQIGVVQCSCADGIGSHWDDGLKGLVWVIVRLACLDSGDYTALTDRNIVGGYKILLCEVNLISIQLAFIYLKVGRKFITTFS